MNDQVNALVFTADGSTLYAGGYFTTAGITTAPYVAVAVSAPGVLDHFAISTITSPQTAGIPLT